MGTMWGLRDNMGMWGQCGVVGPARCMEMLEGGICLSPRAAPSPTEEEEEEEEAEAEAAEAAGTQWGT